MLASIPSATVQGARGRPVDVEVHVATGLPALALVGQPDPACREGLARVRVAFESAQLPWAGDSKKVTINLAPPGFKKLGTGLDAAIALGIAVAADLLPPEVTYGVALVGELGLDGTLRTIPGVVPMVAALAEHESVRIIVVPSVAFAEAKAVGGERVRGVGSLVELFDALVGRSDWPEINNNESIDAALIAEGQGPGVDLADVKGQVVARHAIEVAAAGAHHLLLVGPPGAGKTMLARRLPSILPVLDRAAAIEATCIWSAAGLRLPASGLLRYPPFRSPHHSTSVPALVGGGSALLRPGEASCAHRGVLFLDEMGEFPAAVLDALRTPLEEGLIRVSRARESVELPARFLLVGSTNPCPCGEGGPLGGCRCDPGSRQRYLRRLSGPLLDRFDLRVEVARPTPADLLDSPAGESSVAVAARVIEARALATARGVRANAELDAAGLDEFAQPDRAASAMLSSAMSSGRLSARGLARVRSVARTMADLDGSRESGLTLDHVAAALALRQPLSGLEHRYAA